MYVHLRSRQEHGEKCTERKCGAGCGFVGLEQWLSAPLTATDMREDERIRERSEALLRGEIPT